MRRRAIMMGLLAAAVLSPALARDTKPARVDEPDLSGTYTVALGQTPKGDAYEGVVEIQQRTRVGGKHGTILWDVTWRISSSDTPVRGIGVAVDSAFIVAYGPTAGYGVAASSPIDVGQRQSWMLADDTIRGTWIESSGRTGTEGLRHYSHLHGLIPRLGFFIGHQDRVPATT